MLKHSAMHKHGVVVCEGDAEAAQPRRTRWSHRAHKREEMLGKECKEVGGGCLQRMFPRKRPKIPSGDASPRTWICVTLFL